PPPMPQSWPDWAAAHVAGGDVPPARVVADPYPTLHSIVVDAQHDRVFVSDPNRHALWSYERGAASKGLEPIVPLTGIRGPSTGMMFIAAVTVDPSAQEIYTVDNDIGDRLMVFPYDADGDVTPRRRGAGGEQGPITGGRFDPASITVYAGEATGNVAPIRKISGSKTGLNWPMALHGDVEHNEIAVANSGDSSIRIFSRTA